MEEWREQSVPIGKIICDENLQIRVQLDEARVAEFVALYEQLPPCKVIMSDGKYYLADGFHRYEAAMRKDEKVLWCMVKDGQYKDALELAVRENAKGPLTLSREDKRRAIEKMLVFFSIRANSWIAEDVGVAMQTVESVRDSLEQQGTIKHHDELLRRDDKTTPRQYAVSPTIAKSLSVDKDIAAGVEAMSQEDRDQLMELTSKAMGKKRSIDQSQDTVALTGEELRSIERVLGSDRTRTGSVGNIANMQFVGENAGVFAEITLESGGCGVRALDRDGAVILTLYEIMKAPDKLFPKASAKMSIAEFGEFIAGCAGFLETKLDK